MDFFGFILPGFLSDSRIYRFMPFDTINIFHHYFFKYFFSPTLFIFFCQDSNDMIRAFIIFPQVSEALLICVCVCMRIFFLLFRLCNFYCSIVKFNDFFPWSPPFGFWVCSQSILSQLLDSFSFINFHLVLLSIFYFFNKNAYFLL